MGRFSRLSLPLSSLAILLAVTVAPRAAASGFQLRDQSASGQGNAYAGASAGGADISSMFFNPAALTRYQGNQLQVGLTGIFPSSKFSDGVSSRSASAVPIGGATSTGNVAKSATLPTLYAMWSLNQDLKLGLSVNVPFGLTTEYDPTWAGRYMAVKSHLETLDITPTLAYRMDPKWSLGVAFVARRAKAELSQAIDSGSVAQTAFQITHLNNPILTSGAVPDGFVDVKGSSWAYGYKLGLIYEPSASLRLGLGYQSEIRETIKGTATFTTPAIPAQVLTGLQAANPDALPGAVGNVLHSLALASANGSASAVVNLPATISLGMIYDLSSTFSLAAEISDTKWSSFKELRVKFSNAATQPDQYTAENWKDALFVALGATCKPGNAWTYRVGVAMDKTPVPEGNRTPRIPDADRTWISGGVSYQFTRDFGVDVGYSHLFCKNSTVDLQGGSDPSDQAKYDGGNLSGSYKNSIDILAVQARYTF